ncbi:MAG TPA: aminopeptidase P N-terminal domain-containing protein [Gemmatimonadaceae bacterium]|nr:aminopeptidase P N-terminal domain-containing protein [Gemmatimonadaceae bacterium]
MSRATLPLFSLLLWTAPLSAQIAPAEYAARRDTLAARIDSGVVVAFGARDETRHYPSFTQRPAFSYLTGFRAPDAALVMVKRGGRTTGTLFVQPRDARREFYTGARVTPEDIARQTGLAARRNDELASVLDSLARVGLPFWVVGDFESNEFADADSLSFGAAATRSLRQRFPSLDVRDATPIVDLMRARKSPAEVALLRKAIAITDQAHREAMAFVAPGRAEFEVEALVDYTFRRLGGDRPAYSSIVGGGPNSTTLHYSENSRVLRAGDVLVMDVGALYQGYAADVTRTIPVSGTFSAAQREVYRIVREAQAAGERQVRAGGAAKLEVDSIRAVVARGLARLGLIESPDATFDAPKGFCRGADDVCPQLSLFMPHGPTHGIGLDVHDPAHAYVEPNVFRPGDAVTIEPGVYVRPGALDMLPDTPRNRAFIARVRPAVEKYRDIGVRIEDDYLVTETGLERLSKAPREIEEIEAAMRKQARVISQ